MRPKGGGTIKKATNNLRIPIKGMTVETFVREYKLQSQMDTNTINGLNLSGRGAKIMGDLRRAVKYHE